MCLGVWEWDLLGPHTIIGVPEWLCPIILVSWVDTASSSLKRKREGEIVDVTLTFTLCLKHTNMLDFHSPSMRAKKVSGRNSRHPANCLHDFERLKYCVILSRSLAKKHTYTLTRFPFEQAKFMPRSRCRECHCNSVIQVINFISDAELANTLNSTERTEYVWYVQKRESQRWIPCWKMVSHFTQVPAIDMRGELSPSFPNDVFTPVCTRLTSTQVSFSTSGNVELNNALKEKQQECVRCSAIRTATQQCLWLLRSP